MSYRIELHPLALQEMKESYQWYEERSEGLGTRFLAAIQKSFNSISVMPESHAKKKGNYREVLVQGFPFTIIYESLSRSKIIFVSHVFHTKRDPKLKYRK